ncbi:MAG: DNA replication/repair protein RecF [Deltaproteobacteria bacterium]|nr:DNA replication/repair protein RecF [Deltaproteobacteria bacterium]
MKITRLAAEHFRNLAPFDLTLSGDAVVLCGGNGQGKTNLLEALYVAATGRSFRHAAQSDIIAFGEPRARLSASFVRQGVHHALEVELSPGHRRLQVDSRGVRHAARLLELLNVVAFFPDDLRVAKGAPEERRRLLDRAIGNYRPEFVEASLAYARILKSRNVLLRDRTRRAPQLLQTYDDELVRYGAVIHSCRVEGLSILAPLAAARFAAIMPSAGALALALHSGVVEAPGEAFADGFRRGLVAARSRDLARGTTGVGPHRADLVLSIAGRDARQFASQGQQRAIVLALKLAEVETLTERLSAPPILLLDDISSELDATHTRTLFAAIDAVGSQLWISTTGTARLPLGHAAEVFSVQAGVLEKTATLPG